MNKKSSDSLPPRLELLQIIDQFKNKINAREIFKKISKTYGIKGSARFELRSFIKEQMPQRTPRLPKGSSIKKDGSSLLTLKINQITPEGVVLGTPVDKEAGSSSFPIIADSKTKSFQDLKIDDQVVVKIYRNEMKFIRKLEAKNFIIGVFHRTESRNFVKPTHRKIREEFNIAESDCLNAREGDLVEINPSAPSYPDGFSSAQVVRVLGSLLDPKSMSLIAIHTHNLPTVFSKEALALAEEAQKPVLKDREDLRDIPLVTVDDEDARDFDDAVWAEPDSDLQNAKGWHLIVAIADVSHYVHPQDALDLEALERGNSAYFPDRVVPMLPEALSNELCSLKPQEDRACLAVHLWITQTGKLIRHRFTRGLMRSAERLTYRETQAAIDGLETRLSSDFIQDIIRPLYGAYQALCKGKEKREPLNLDLPEKRIYLNEEGKITHIIPRARFDSHRLIEEFMILANVAAAVALSDQNSLCIYRIHDQPTYEKIEALREFLKGMSLSLPKGQTPLPSLFNHILAKAAQTPYAAAVGEMVLRTQAQAVYSPDNIGHFGLNLPRYAHFTSPIRRYADLLVHRALVATLHLSKKTEFPYNYDSFKEMSVHISMTERRAAQAERETIDRYVSAYLANTQGQIFQGRIVGVTEVALFLRLSESGADGMIPLRLLKQDYFVHDPVHHQLVGRRTGKIYALGDEIKVKLLQADPFKGSLIFEPLEDKISKTFSQSRKKEKSKNSRSRVHKDKQ